MCRRTASRRRLDSAGLYWSFCGVLVMGEDTVWVAIDKFKKGVFRQVVGEIDGTDSDRAAAIVAGSFVEDHLTELLKWNFIQDTKLLDELFRVSGPVGNFGTKIDLGYLHRLYSKVAWKELDTIKEIRNAFAHKMEIKDFSNDRMHGLADNLVMWEKKAIKMIGPENPRAAQAVRLEFGGEFKEGRNQALMFRPTTKGSKLPPRERFINACKFYVAAINIVIRLPQHHEEPSF